MIHLGDVPASSTIYIPFATYGKTNGESITCSGLAVTDIEIYKNGSTTQRSSDAGYTLLDTDGIDFDGITGLHGFSIDLSDNTDASFYAVGSWYWVVVSAITVDSQTVTFLAATFRIAPAEAIAGHPKTDVGGWLGTAPATPTVAGVPKVDVTHLLGTAHLTPTTAGKPDVNVLTMTTNVISASVLAANTGLKPLYTGSVTSGSATTYVMSGITAANDDINGYRLRMTSGAMVGQVRMIKDWISGTNTLHLDTAFSTALSAADTFVIEPAQVNLKHINDVAASGVATPDVNVVSIANNAITAAAIATNAIDADAIAADAVTEIQSGLATAASITALDADIQVIDGNVDIIKIVTDTIDSTTTQLGSDLAALSTDVSVVDTVVDAILVLAGTTDTAVSQLPDASTISTAVVSGMDSNTSLVRCVQRLGFLMAQEIGACADAGTAAESYTITINSTTYTVDHVGLDSTGNRGTAVLTQT